MQGCDGCRGGFIGDPQYVTCRYINDIPQFPVRSGSSAELHDGRVVQPRREVPIFHETDVLVVGGGPAGFAAAVASARTGAKTVLLERYGSLGGLFTNGLVLIIVGSADGCRHGEQRLVTRGICEEFLKRCKAMGSGAYFTDDYHGSHQPTIDPESAKILMDRMVKAERNLEVFFHCWGVDVILDGQTVRGVVFESKQGRQAVLARRVVDCTGDGDVAFQAGADFRQITHNLGFVYQIGGLGRASDGQLGSKEADGFPKIPNEPIAGAFWKNNLGPQANGLSVRELTAAEFLHRENAWNLIDRMRSTPGFEQTYIMNTCSQVGVRASRLIRTDHVLDMSETDARKTFDDAIGMSGDDEFTPRGAFQIPYRSLLPTGVENLLVAGRSIGVNPNVIDRVRLIPVCMVTGQAAGTAAALSAAEGVTPRALDAKALRRRLEADNVFIA